VDRVTGLSPSVAIEQRNASRTPRSTLGTETQIYDYLRVLYARLGTPYCPDCGEPLGARTIDDLVEAVADAFADRGALILAPLRPSGNEEYVDLFARAQREGWRRVRIDGEVTELPPPRIIDRRRRHQVELVVDRLPPHASRSRLAEAVERALQVSGGQVVAAPMDEEGQELHLSRDFGCPRCGASYPELTPRSFSFNHPEGWCPACEGLGTRRGLDPEIMVPDGRLSLRQGAVTIWPQIPPGSLLERTLEAVAAYGGFTLDQPFDSLTEAQRRLVFEGSPQEIEVQPNLRVRFLGLAPGIEEASNLSHDFRRQYARALGDLPCPACQGGRLNRLAAAVRFRGRTLVELCELPLSEVHRLYSELELTETERARVGEVLGEVQTRLAFLVQVGLGYLTLHRTAPTLSGGEAQRVKLAAQLGAGLTGVLYVLDEPTVGIHPRDNDRMLAALKRLRDLGNTVVVVEHDPQTMHHADHLIDFGPGAGPSGGRVVAEGSFAALQKARESLTGALLRRELVVPVPEPRRPVPAPDKPDGWLRIEGARHHNLKNIDVALPLGVMVAVTGPSGSGKSSLIHDILYEELSYRLHGRNSLPGHHRAIHGWRALRQVVNIDQSPIGASPRSNPATYIGAFDAIRELFALLPEAKVRGYGPGRFSFNVPGGRCEVCEGMGYRIVEMHFLPDVWAECEECRGRRYNAETLAIQYRGKSIADVLEMSVDQALQHFSGLPRICRPLQLLSDVGLGYLPLGQAAPTLSGGEAQRVKIARELVSPSPGHTLYLLDEPTTGLHVADIRKLLAVLNRLVDAGNTVVLIEHNMDVVKTADWVVDLGPEGGEAGGYLVACGPPEAVAACPASPTAKYLRQALELSPREDRRPAVPVGGVTEEKDTEKIPDVGAGALRPWEVDGERWHCHDRVNALGESPAWHDEALTRFVEQWRALPGASEPNWRHWSDVRFGPENSEPPFALARTHRKWYLELHFYVPKGIFDQESLAHQLGLLHWDQLQGVPFYSRSPRVRVYTGARRFDRVLIQAHFGTDVTSEGFRDFLKKAWKAWRNVFDPRRGRGGA
jgi:excinuclease ABC subunit A